MQMESSLNTSELIPGSKYFTWGEALWLPRVEAYAKPTEAQKSNIIRQAKYLDKIREHYGKPVIVHSWLCTREYNKLIGGAPASWHMQGLATDFHVEGVSIEKVKKDVEGADLDLYPGRGERDTINWIHLDLGGTNWFNAGVGK